jgi:hypothetical protein
LRLEPLAPVSTLLSPFAVLHADALRLRLDLEGPEEPGEGVVV